MMSTNAYTETSWFHALANAPVPSVSRAGALNLCHHMVKNASHNGQSFFYFGKEIDRFVKHFTDVGLVMVKAKHNV